MKSWWDFLYSAPILPASFVVYPSEPQPTGVLNADGRPIYRDPEPIGFLTADVLRPADRQDQHCRIGKVRWK